MAFAQYVVAAAPVEASTCSRIPSSKVSTPSFFPAFKWPLKFKPYNLFLLSCLRRTTAHSVKTKAQESELSVAAHAFTHLKHLLLPITDRNPYLSEGTRQAAATAAALAKKYGADITVVVIDEKSKESHPEHGTQLASIHWHLSEGGFQKFRLLEKLGEGSQPTAIIGEVADDLSLDLVILSMEAIHSKHVDANLLAEFIPCPVLLLPL